MSAAQEHGTRSRYVLGCRCADCREANRVYCADARARRRADPALAGVAGHGKATTYTNYDCRCDLCRAARARSARIQRGGRS